MKCRVGEMISPAATVIFLEPVTITDLGDWIAVDQLIEL
jgi:hypothetical protein